MRHLMIRLASILILVLGFTPMASAAEVWSFAHFVETEGSQTPKSFDSVLFLINKDGQVHNCKIDLRNESNLRLSLNGQEVCPLPNLCPVRIAGFAKVRIHDLITRVAGPQWPVVLGEIRLTCTEPLFGLNATLYVTNYHDEAFKAAFTVDQGKILP